MTRLGGDEGRMPTAEQWRKRQDAYKAACERIVQAERDIAERYHTTFSTCRSWIPRAERRRLESLRERADRISDKIIDWLYEYSPRHTAWGSGVPLWWICTELSLEDALTAGPLSVTPPLAYGQTEAGRRAFCQGVTSHVA